MIKITKASTAATKKIPDQTPALKIAPIASQLLSKKMIEINTVVNCKFLFILYGFKKA